MNKAEVIDIKYYRVVGKKVPLYKCPECDGDEFKLGLDKEGNIHDLCCLNCHIITLVSLIGE